MRLTWGRGIPDAVADTIIPARYNNIDFLRRLFEREGDDIAAIIVEPVLGNAQGIMPAPGLPPGDAGADRGVRDPPDLRRGEDRLPLRARRRRGVLRDHARSRDVCQGDGQRLPGGGLRRARRGHERAPRQGQPRRHVRGQPGCRRGRVEDARDHPRHRRARHDPGDRPADPGRPARGPQPDRRCRTSSPAIPRCSGSCSPTRCATEYRDWADTDHELYDALAIGDAGTRRDARARQPRAVVRVRGPRAGRHRRPRRDGVPGGAGGHARGPAQGRPPPDGHGAMSQHRRG